MNDEGGEGAGSSVSKEGGPCVRRTIFWGSNDAGCHGAAGGFRPKLQLLPLAQTSENGVTALLAEALMPACKLTGAEIQRLPDAYQMLLRNNLKRTVELFSIWDSSRGRGGVCTHHQHNEAVSQTTIAAPRRPTPALTTT